MKIEETSLKGAVVILPEVYSDCRGKFFETFNQEKFKQFGLPIKFYQENQSESYRGVLRGLHFQKPPFAQGKLVRVIVGKVLDVAVDLRKNSKTFGNWYSVVLSGKNRKMFYIPGGFAHGFLALDDTVLCYNCTAPYNRQSESGIRWDDPTLAVDWQLNENKLRAKELILSDKDANLIFFRECLSKR